MQKSRWGTIGLGIIALAFGLGCLNYTRAEGLDHHREWAQAHNMPAPRPPIFLLGVASAVLGAGTVGYGLASRKSLLSQSPAPIP